jgi:hypothetical protein
MVSPVQRRATYADLLGVPENQVGEIIDGELFTQPRPAAPHARAASRLGIDLGGPFDRGKGGPGGWIILYEPELHLHGDALVPDLAGWRRERMPEMPHAAAFELAPDWVCDVLSPATQRPRSHQEDAGLRARAGRSRLARGSLRSNIGGVCPGERRVASMPKRARGREDPSLALRAAGARSRGALGALEIRAVRRHQALPASSPAAAAFRRLARRLEEREDLVVREARPAVVRGGAVVDVVGIVMVAEQRRLGAAVIRDATRVDGGAVGD